MNRKRLHKGIRSEKGSATLEFAVVLPAILLILVSIIEFGRVFMVYQMVTSAAREGARMAVLPGADNAKVMERINEELTHAGLAADSVTFTPADVETADQNDPVTVQVQINYESIAMVPGFIPGLSGLTLQGSVVMRKEGFG